MLFGAASAARFDPTTKGTKDTKVHEDGTGAAAHCLFVPFVSFVSFVVQKGRAASLRGGFNPERPRPP